MKVIPARPFALGIDTVVHLSADKCASLAAHGMSFAVRYLPSLTVEEVATITGWGLGLMGCAYSRKEGWVPSKELGALDGTATVRQALALGFPQGATLWLDLEGCAGPAWATAAWVDEWAMLVRNAGYIAGLYVGANPGGLNSASLWELHVQRYWHSCSQVPNVDRCGYCMVQLSPPNTKVGDVHVDVDVIQQDYLERLPTWVVSDEVAA